MMSHGRRQPISYFRFLSVDCTLDVERASSAADCQRTTLHPEEVHVNGIFDLQQIFSQRVFRIPDYQRGYAWERDQWRDLKEDLQALPSGKDHYTGTLVLCPREQERRRDSRGSTYDVFDIVDGQQRLTTLVILLNAIRKSMIEDNSDSPLATGIEERFVRAIGRDGQPFYKLTLNEDCREFFERNVIGDSPSTGGPAILSHRRLLEADSYFAQWISRKKSQAAGEFQDWLVELHDKVTERLKMSVYEVGDEAEVGVIFEVMNDRGKPLSELEKVKNFLLYAGYKLELHDHNLPSTVNSIWRDLLERLMRAGLGRTGDEDRLLRAHWLAAYDANSRSWSGSRSVKARFSLLSFQGRHAALLDGLLTYVRGLNDASIAFCDAYRPEREDAFSRFTDTGTRREIVRWSSKLIRLDAVAVFVPLLISFRLAAPDEAHGYLALIKACEKYAFRVYRLAQRGRQRRSDAGAPTLYRYAYEVFHGFRSRESIDCDVLNLSADYCSRKEFEGSFDFDEEKNWYNWSGLRYFLYEYEEYLSQGAPTALDWTVFDRRELGDSIEHILPQTLSPVWTQQWSDESHGRFVHDIGNLTLTYYNGSYGNSSFPEKQGTVGDNHPAYANSSLHQERELMRYEDWSEASLLDRRNKLVEWAKSRWEIPP